MNEDGQSLNRTGSEKRRNINGRALNRARAEKHRQERQSIAEAERRREVTYAEIPRLREIDEKLKEQMSQVVLSVWDTGVPLQDIMSGNLSLQAERRALLEQHRLPADWLDGAWRCPVCRDTGYVEGVMCDCLRKIYEKERTRELSALLKLGDSCCFENFDLMLYDDRTDSHLGMSPREQMTTVLNFCHWYARNFERGKSDNLLLQGGTGLGKTFLSGCIAREVSQNDFSVVYETITGAIEPYEALRFRREDSEDQDTPAERVRRLEQCDLLILDDLGTELANNFTKSALYTLINNRLTAGRATIASTNLTNDELRAFYTPQIVSRLLGEYQLLPFVGRDIRMILRNRAAEE